MIKGIIFFVIVYVIIYSIFEFFSKSKPKKRKQTLKHVLYAGLITLVTALVIGSIVMLF